MSSVMTKMKTSFNDMMRIAWPEIKFGSQQHKALIKTFFGGAYTALQSSGQMPEGVHKEIAAMFEIDWNPDESFLWSEE